MSISFARGCTTFILLISLARTFLPLISRQWGMRSTKSKRILFWIAFLFKNFQNFVKIFFCFFVEQSIDNDAKSNGATMTWRQQRRWKDAKSGAEAIQNGSKWLECSKTFRRLYVFRWAHCFGLFWFSDGYGMWYLNFALECRAKTVSLRSARWV